MKKILLALSLIIAFAGIAHAKGPSAYSKPEVRKFVRYMAKKHNFDQKELAQLFKQVEWSPVVRRVGPAPKKKRKPVVPAEKKPWWQYKAMIVNQARIDEGVAFWKKNEATLKEAERVYGVPPEMIVGTLGVETRYGRITGKHKTLDVLTTLSFNKTRRNKFFKSELEQFLLLTREQKINSLSVKGSYAGALGWPQFMPSSYRKHAVKHDNKKRHINLFDNPSDIIFSIANYYKKHGWIEGEPVVAEAKVVGKKHKSIPKKGFRPIHTVSHLKSFGVEPTSLKGQKLKKKAIHFDLKDKSKTQHCLGFNNFFVIMRYNPDRKYSMAVYSLGQEIKSAVKKDLKHSRTLSYNEKK